MPLYDLSYRHFDGPRTSRLERSWALARSGLRLLLRQRRFLLLIAIAWVPAVIRGVQIYIAYHFPPAVKWLAVDASLWKTFLTQQVSGMLVLLVALYAGSGAIASDLRAGALVIYLSKPLSRLDYVVAKAIPVATAILAITLLPGLGLLGLHLSLADDLRLLRENPWLPLSILLYSGTVAAYFSLTVLAASSLSRSGRLAAAGFVMAALGSHFAYRVFSQMRFEEAPPFLSMVGSTVHAADVFFDGASTHPGSPLVSLLAMALLMTASAFLIDRRLRSAEVFS